MSTTGAENPAATRRSPRSCMSRKRCTRASPAAARSSFSVSGPGGGNLGSPPGGGTRGTRSGAAEQPVEKIVPGEERERKIERRDSRVPIALAQGPRLARRAAARVEDETRSDFHVVEPLEHALADLGFQLRGARGG